MYILFFVSYSIIYNYSALSANIYFFLYLYMFFMIILFFINFIFLLLFSISQAAIACYSRLLIIIDLAFNALMNLHYTFSIIFY